jgi:perosamine synthetase
MLVTDDESIAKKCRVLRNLCFQPEKRFIHKELGWNFRLTNMQAAIGLAQIERLDEFIDKKRNMGQKYTNLLKGLKNIQLPIKKTDYADNIYWVYGLVIDEKYPKDAQLVMDELKQIDIGTRPFFWPLHEQPLLKKYKINKNGSYPVAERIARKGFYIPSGLALTNNEIVIVSDAINSVFK